MTPEQERQQHICAAYRAAQSAIPMFVVYRPITSDHPGKWVARMHLTEPAAATDLLIEADTLVGIRIQLPPEAVNIGRYFYDNPVIEEVWL
ncbi:hypothetical protein NKW84_10170 [Acetobacter senegalensis]|uniref:Uncharacterized protein n=1 Tax=Acetobacter senegalensis TaxID=446692 RepID=A0A0U4Y2W6_9PROT|nr:hypothetical protein [Acetobacter senegalensis]MCP1196223.1 hypothetical protein [Acetobacter senegalensis]CEF41262.1 hypothetical protein predicted by Glimmer/Critica [Acetobacter senegalensis]